METNGTALHFTERNMESEARHGTERNGTELNITGRNMESDAAKMDGSIR